MQQGEKKYWRDKNVEVIAFLVRIFSFFGTIENEGDFLLGYLFMFRKYVQIFIRLLLWTIFA